jgi:predicted phage baseplate assembly protein
MLVPAPLIDKRSVNDLVARTETLLQRYSTWRPAEDGNDAGRALVRIFARLAELVIDRLNQVPDKNFLAFLDLVGLELLPPQPARVPLTFHLAVGSTTDALVPARTQVAAIPVEGETEPVIFETERELVVTRSQLVAAFTREPGRDRYSDHTAVATGVAEDTFSVFQGDRPIEHRLYLGHSGLFGIDVTKTIILRIGPAEGDESWLSAVEWGYWDGTAWKTALTVSAPTPVSGSWEVALSHVPAIPATPVGGQTSAWLRGRLTIPLPRGELVQGDGATAQTHLRQHDLMPDAGFADNVPRDFTQTFYPFGQITPRSIFYLASDETFSKPGARVEISIDVDAAQPARPSTDLVLAWEYWDGANWQIMGQSSPGSTSATPSSHDFTDETEAFTRDGAVTFRAPDHWAARTVTDESGFWLRVRIAAGDYGSPPDYRPPAVQRLALGYEWPLPRIDTIQIRVSIQRAGFLPDLAFTNQLGVDLSKDFFPFGEKPKFNDTLYLASDEAFTRPNATITLTIALTNPSNEQAMPLPAKPSDTLTLIWEFWNGQQGKWDLLGESVPGEQQPSEPNRQYSFNDGTKAFVKDGPVTFTCPETMGSVGINGQLRHWIRVRIIGGDYGVEARYEPVRDQEGRIVVDPTTKAPIYQLTPATFRPPSIKSITLSYDYTSPLTALDYTLSENDFVMIDRSQQAKTSGQVFNPYTPTMAAQPTFYLGFQRPGADIGFANRSTALYFRVAEVLYGESPAVGQAIAVPAAVIWEYWNGSQWTRLGTRDETQGLTRRGLLTFIGPADFRASMEFGLPAFWLRARLDRGGYTLPPQLRRVLTNTMWAAHTLTVQNEILGSSNGEPNQVFRTSKAPVLPGQRLEVREPEMPSAAERAATEAEEGEDAITAVLDPSGRPTDIWVRWHQMPDFYESRPRSRHYTIDRLTGDVRFGDGKRGLVPPQGRGNMRAALYQTGGGPQGNRPPDAITQLKSAVPYVDRVTNGEPAGGGSAQETLEALKTRGPKTLRHRNRAVAIADFEDLAFEVSPEVARVKGIAVQGSEGAGSVGLILVPTSRDRQPIPSLELLSRVEGYIQARLAPTVDLWVAGPDWLQVSVTAEVVPIAIEMATDVQVAVLARLAAFLHPLTGALDGQGWAFGRKPYRSDLYTLIESTPGVDHVRRLTVVEEGDVSPDRFLVSSGDHQITMVSEVVD